MEIVATPARPVPRPPYAKRPRIRHVDARIAELAGGQFGVVSREQVLGLGLSRDALKGRLRTGRLHPIHRGVYSVGHRALTSQGRWLAATLYGGSGAALSHRPAGSLHGLRPWRGRPAVTVSGWRPSTDAIEFHASRLPEDETALVQGIRVTSVPRTILDMAVDLGRVGTERAINEAEAQCLSGALSLADLLDRYQGRRGCGIVRAILAERSAMLGVTESELEELFQSFLIKHGLPRPKLNEPVQIGDRRIRVDCMWPEKRLIVELDGMRWHNSPDRGNRDRARDRQLTLLGYRVIRITWAHLRDEPARLAADLRALLA